MCNISFIGYSNSKNILKKNYIPIVPTLRCDLVLSYLANPYIGRIPYKIDSK
jgi:hypothetical protein